MTLSTNSRANDFVCNLAISDAKKLPKELDWDDKNKVSPVKNQLTCGACYIFSALGALESQYLLKGEEYSFSEQVLLNCLNTGCKGGSMDIVWDYIILNGVPDDTDDDNKYVGKVRHCKRISLQNS